MNDETIKEDKKMENGINGEKQVDEFFKVMHAHVHLTNVTHVHVRTLYTVRCVQSSIINRLGKGSQSPPPPLPLPLTLHLLLLLFVILWTVSTLH